MSYHVYNINLKFPSDKLMFVIAESFIDFCDSKQLMVKFNKIPKMYPMSDFIDKNVYK